MARPTEGSKLTGALVGVGIVAAIWAVILLVAWLVRDEKAGDRADGGAADASGEHGDDADAGASSDARALVRLQDARVGPAPSTDVDGSSGDAAASTPTTPTGDAGLREAAIDAGIGALRGDAVAYDVCPGERARIATGVIGRGPAASIVVACNGAAHVITLADGRPTLVATLDEPDAEAGMFETEATPIITDATGDGLGDVVVGCSRLSERGGPRLAGAWIVPGARAAARVGARSIALGPANVTSIAAAEIDGQRGTELLVGHMGNWYANETNEVRVFRGGARPTRSTTIRTDGIESVSVASADLTRDGHVDLVVAHEERGGLTVFTGDGRGGFGDARSFSDVQAYRAVVVDLDGDRLPEVLLEGQDGFSVLDGNPGEIAPPRAIGFARERVFLATDLDGDHVTDVLVALGTDTFYGPEWWDISVQRGRGDGTFEVRELLRSGFHPIDLAVGDLDGDGALDLAWLGVVRELGEPERSRVVLQVAPRITLRGENDAAREGPRDVEPLPRASAVVTVALR